MEIEPVRPGPESEGPPVTRKQFTTGCAACLGSCAAGLIQPQAASAQSGISEIEILKGKLDAAQIRFAKLVGILSKELDPTTRKKVFETLGRECARQFRSLTDPYANNLKGFLDEAQKRWVETVEYDEQAGTIRIVDRSTTCTCPLVSESLMPPEFCDCTLGWQKEAYSAIVGRPVEAEIEESILRGGNRCVFRISIPAASARNRATEAAL